MARRPRGGVRSRGEGREGSGSWAKGDGDRGPGVTGAGSRDEAGGGSLGPRLKRAGVAVPADSTASSGRGGGGAESVRGVGLRARSHQSQASPGGARAPRGQEEGAGPALREANQGAVPP